MLQELIDTFEEVKKYVFIIDRGTKERIIIKFNNDNFYHLIGLHKTNIDMFFPSYIKSKDKKYKYLKKNVDKFDSILLNQTGEKEMLELRVKTFHYIINLLEANENTTLYDLKEKVPGSLYNGDYGLLKICEQVYCLLGLKSVWKTENEIHCVPQSWMASKRVNKLIEYKKPIYMRNILIVPVSMYNEELDIVNA